MEKDGILSLRLGLVALIIVLIQVGMVFYAVQPIDYTQSRTTTATEVSTAYYRALYGVSDYMYPYHHDGDLYWCSMQWYAEMSVNVTLVLEALGIDSIYLIRFSIKGYVGSEGHRYYIESDVNSSIKLVEFDLAVNTVCLDVFDIPENTNSKYAWWLVFFCSNMAYQGEMENYNPYGKIEVTIEVIGNG